MKKEINFETINDLVDTKYGDLTGVIKLDCHDNIMAIYKMCADLNIDTSGKFIVGFGMGEDSIIGIGQHGSSCRVLYLDENVYGSTYDEIQRKIANAETVDVGQFSFSLSYEQLSKYIKRFDFLATTDLLKIANNINITEK